MKHYKLLQDIVIKAGTEFRAIDKETLATVFGLTKDSYGEIIYYLDNDDEIKKWFKVVK